MHECGGVSLTKRMETSLSRHSGAVRSLVTDQGKGFFLGTVSGGML